MRKIKIKDNLVINSDSSKALKWLKENIETKPMLAITSPPYFNLRQYTDNEEEIGNESDVNEYVSALKKVFAELYDVLDDNGSFYLNIGDTYLNGDLAMVPERVALACKELGFILRNTIIWHKPNSLPSSVKNRFTTDYEYMYFFTKKNKKYLFNQQFEPFKNLNISKKSPSIKKSDSKYANTKEESKYRQGLNSARGEKLIERRPLLPEQQHFVNILRDHFTISEIVEKTNLKHTTVSHWFRRDEIGFSYPSKDDWKIVMKSLKTSLFKEELTTIEMVTDELKFNKNGRNKRSVWEIPVGGNKFKHFASFPKRLVTTPILASTNPGDYVLDPFAGSGTVGEAAIENNRKFIGIDLSEEYIKIIEKRLKTCIKEKKK